jgi:hypothetical protein
MSALLASQRSITILKGRDRRALSFPGKGDGFPSDESKPVSTKMTARPIPPEKGSRRRHRRRRRRGLSRGRKRISPDGPKHSTHATRFFGGGMFLTLLAQWAGTAIPDAPSIQDAQRAIVFWSAFLRVERAISGTTQGSIGLQRKSRARKTAGKGTFGPLRRAIHDSGRRRNHMGRSKDGGAHGRRSEVLAQGEAQIPEPLRQDLKELLPTGRVRDPAVGVLLDVFIREDGLKGATMQIEIEHIFGAEGW